jgi:uncharacterized protein DUF642
MRRTRKGTVGSNPTLSANLPPLASLAFWWRFVSPSRLMQNEPSGVTTPPRTRRFDDIIDMSFGSLRPGGSMRILAFAATAALLLTEAIHAQNLLQNGSFEDPVVDPGTALLTPTIPGWANTGDPCPIEVQNNCCGSPSDGAQHLELDSDSCSSSISQTVATQPGAKYVLSFDFSPRPSVFDNRVIVSWNGSQVFDLIEISPPGGDVDWIHHTAVVTATGTTSTVDFAGADAPDGVGSYLDNLPEPGRSSPLAAGLLLIAGLDRLRRRTPRSRPRGRSR